MAEINPQERFNQLLAFLKDPQAHPHPTRTIGDSVRLEGRRHSAGMVNDFRQEAIEIMESGMFRQGCLKGNRRTPDIPVKKLEYFVLQVAAAVHLAKLHRDKSPEFQSHDFDRRPRMFDELNEACSDLRIAYNKWATLVVKYELITPDELGLSKKNLEIIQTFKRLQDEGKIEEIDPYIESHRNQIRERVVHKLFKLIDDSLFKASKREEMSFDFVNELIRIFIVNIPQAPDNLIATHITNFINERREHTLKGLPSLWRDTVRKDVEKLRKQAFIIPAK